MDKSQIQWTLSVENMEFYANHGYHSEEEHLLTPFIVDVHVKLDSTDSTGSDKLEDTLNYGVIHSICKQVMQVRFKLIEAVAKTILNRLLDEYPSALSLRVRVTKVLPPIGSKGAHSSIEASWHN